MEGAPYNLEKGNL